MFFHQAGYELHIPQEIPFEDVEAIVSSWNKDHREGLPFAVKAYDGAGHAQVRISGDERKDAHTALDSFTEVIPEHWEHIRTEFVIHPAWAQSNAEENPA